MKVARLQCLGSELWNTTNIFLAQCQDKYGERVGERERASSRETMQVTLPKQSTETSEDRRKDAHSATCWWLLLKQPSTLVLLQGPDQVEITVEHQNQPEELLQYVT